MAPKTEPSSTELGKLMRGRRKELGLTIEQAAASANIGSESWRRYEQGGAIRQDKVRGVCRTLRWPSLPSAGAGDANPADDRASASAEKSMWDLAAEGAGYSRALAADYGQACARVFALGYDFVSDWLKDDIDSLSTMPRGTHLGELGHSWLAGELPARWLTRYDYEFCYRLRGVVEDLRWRLVHPGYDGVPHLTRCPADDLALHLLLQSGASAFDEHDNSPIEDGDVGEWEYELNGEDDEIISALFSDQTHPAKDHSWHFERWFEESYYRPADDADANRQDKNDNEET
jgi:Helix-turn-helix domain